MVILRLKQSLCIPAIRKEEGRRKQRRYNFLLTDASQMLVARFLLSCQR